MADPGRRRHSRASIGLWESHYLGAPVAAVARLIVDIPSLRLRRAYVAIGRWDLQNSHGRSIKRPRQRSQD